MAMTLTIDSIETRNSETKGDYAYGKATINKVDGTSKAATIMSFGPQFASVRDQLVEGAQIRVNAVFNGGILKILSPAPAAQTDEAQAA